MIATFETANARATVLFTDRENVGPDGWLHAEVTGTATDETSARYLAEQIKQALTANRETHWRVSFEYKPYTRLTFGGRVDEWRLFARFSVRVPK